MERFTDDALLTVEEAAAWLRLSPKGLYRMIEDEQVPYLRVGARAIRLQKHALLLWTQRQPKESE